MFLFKNRLQKYIGISILIILGISCFILLTPRGAEFVLSLALDKYIDFNDLTIIETQGRLATTVIFNDIRINGLSLFPANTRIHIQKISCTLYPKPFIEIFNGTLELPDTNSMYFYGSYTYPTCDFNLYTKYCALSDILAFIPKHSSLIKGLISNVSLQIKGTFTEPFLKGSIHIIKAVYKNFILSNVPASFNLRINTHSSPVQGTGEIMIDSGTASAHKTSIDLEKSSIVFTGNIKDPHFMIQGLSKIDTILINIDLQGTLSEPKFLLSSEPQRRQEELLVMLATGKQWKSLNNSEQKDSIDQDLAVDFLDYFVLSGHGSTIAKQLGLKSISLTYEDEHAGVEIQKDITKKASIKYAIKRNVSKTDAANEMKHTIGFGYNISKNISIESEQGIPITHNNSIEKSENSEKRVMLKMKHSF